MINSINTALEAITIILKLSGLFPETLIYIEILLLLIWFSKIKSIYIWKIQIKFSFLNQHIYYPKMVLIK